MTLELFWSADFNADRVVDAADLAAWKTGFASTTPVSHAAGDADGDGDSDGADFMKWQRQLGSASSAAASLAAASQAVPEPGALLTVALAVGGFAAARRRSRIRTGGA